MKLYKPRAYHYKQQFTVFFGLHVDGPIIGGGGVGGGVIILCTT